MNDLISPFVYVLKNTETGDYDIYSTFRKACMAVVDAVEDSFEGREDLFLHEVGEICGKPSKEAFLIYLSARRSRLHDYGFDIESRCVRD